MPIRFCDAVSAAPCFVRVLHVISCRMIYLAVEVLLTGFSAEPDVRSGWSLQGGMLRSSRQYYLFAAGITAAEADAIGLSCA